MVAFLKGFIIAAFIISSVMFLWMANLFGNTSEPTIV
jgi:hypothetical protein